ncbi:MAG: hypothetical protein J6D44_16485, partial [Pseudomonas sp.]|nr:hypothetical protein [Pseudomonas sp.]
MTPVLAGRQRRGKKQNCGAVCFFAVKKQRACTRIACKPLICLVPEAGIEPARPYERGILSP